MQENLEKKLSDMKVRVDDWLDQARNVAAKASGLSTEARQQLPPFPHTFQRSEISAYLRRLREAVEHPLKEEARTLIESVGVNPTSVSDEILLDLEGLYALVAGFNTLRDAQSNAADRLVRTGVLAQDLRIGLPVAQTRIDAVLQHQQALKRLSSGSVPPVLQERIMAHFLRDVATLPRLQLLLQQLDRAADYGVILNEACSFEELSGKSSELSTALDTLQETFGLDRETIQEQIQGKALEEACTHLLEFQRHCYRTCEALREEIDSYSRLLGKSTPAANTLEELQRWAETLEREAIENLGVEGLDLVRFFYETTEFPDHLSKDSIRRALEYLRPRIREFLREGRDRPQ